MNEQNVLIAEDDDEDFEIFSSAITELPISVKLTRAENGDILMSVLYKDQPDILFLDILMPCKDGKQCLKEIRSDRRFDTLPVIMYTSFSNLSDVEFSFREGANFYAVKPASFTELKNILSQLLNVQWKKMMYYPPFSDFVINPPLNN